MLNLPTNDEKTLHQGGTPDYELLEDVTTDSEGQASWIGITAIIIANFMGTGILSLGFSAAALGWFPFVAMLAICCAGATYSGNLYKHTSYDFPDKYVPSFCQKFSSVLMFDCFYCGRASFFPSLSRDAGMPCAI